MPRRKEIKNSVGSDLYSVEVYDSLAYFANFNPNVAFDKWAAVPVNHTEFIPENMESLCLPAGLYAVFAFKGAAAEVPVLYQHILGTWLPNSDYQLDNRPHFAVMGEKYKNNDPDSEEELWIPIKTQKQ